MTTPTLIDHYDVGTGLLLAQYKEKPNIDAMLKTYFDASQVVEQDLYDIMTKTLFLNAEGANLERYGDLFNIKRGATVSDKDYREQLIAEIIRRSSDGTPDGIRKIIEATTGMVDSRIYEHMNTRTITGGVFVYGYSPTALVDAINLDGNEGTYVKNASPVTTGSCVLGLHTKRFVDVDELFIPSEFLVALEPLRVSDGSGGLDFLVNETDDFIAMRGSNNLTYGLGWESGLLAEYGTAVEAFHVEQTSEEERFLVEAGNGVESFKVEVDGIETNHGVLLETSQFSIGDPL